MSEGSGGGVGTADFFSLIVLLGGVTGAADTGMDDAAVRGGIFGGSTMYM